MVASSQIDATQFNRAVRDLARLTGRSFADVLREEAGKILESASRKTNSAKVSKIREQFNDRSWTTYQGKKYDIKQWRLPDPLWNEIQQQREARLQKRLAARGLGKQSFFLLARALGITIRVPAYVRKASASGVNLQGNVTGIEQGSGTRYGIEMINRSPVATSAGARGRGAMQRAVNGRVRFFENNVRRGTFLKSRQILAKYPGIKVEP